MTIKLMLVKSGEDLIADIAEMVTGEGEERRVIGYYLTKPCVVKMRNPNTIDGTDDTTKKSGFEVFLYPWIPLSADEKIPIPSDWLITMVEPTAKLKEMYVEDVLNYGKKTSKDLVSDEQLNSDQSD